MAPILRQVYEQMSEPRWLLQLALVLPQEVFSTPTLQGIDKVIPVDVYVPGCPPRPEQIVDGVMKLQELVRTENVRRRSSEYQELLASYNIK
jgi:NADH-quinone oxidoreductase subunit B